MTEKEINIAIAEECGWDCDPIEAHGWQSRGQWAKHSRLTSDKLVSLGVRVPKYCADLNAMHEAETLFYGNSDTPQGAERMSAYSLYICQFRYPIHATARQKAEAFLKTIGKWRV
jgi:hypothetical protein